MSHSRGCWKAAADASVSREPREPLLPPPSMNTKACRTEEAAVRLFGHSVVPVHLGMSRRVAYASSPELLDLGYKAISEYSFTGPTGGRRTLRVFRLRNGDIAYRAFDSVRRGEKWVSDTPRLATRLFKNERQGLSYLSQVAKNYRGCRNWLETRD